MFCKGLLRWVCALCLGTSLLSAAAPVLAQPYDPYVPPERNEFQDKEINDTKKAAKEVADTMHKTLGKVNEAVQEISGLANQVAPGGAISSRNLMGYDNIAIKHPHGDQGHLPRGESWDVYAEESKSILGKNAAATQKFVNCVEWREVKETEYVEECKINCPDYVDPTNSIPIPGLRCRCLPLVGKMCLKQRRMVIEYYWPQYTVATNKAGSRDLDPTQFGPQARPDLERPRIIQAWRNLHQQVLQRLTRKIPGFDPSKFEPPSWWQGEFELQQHGFGDAPEGQDSLSFARAYRPNFEWRAANDRPRRDWLGWFWESRSIHWALPKPPVQKNIMTNSSDQQLLWMMSIFPEFMQLYELLDTDDYREIVGMQQNIFANANNTIWQERLGPSLRAARRGDDGERDYSELRVLGVVPRDDGKRDRDIHLLRSGETLRLDNLGTMFSPVLSRQAAIAASWLFVYGSTKPSIQAYNTTFRRHSQFSLYKLRDSKQRTTYVGMNPRPEKNRVVDKLSFTSPTKTPGEGSYCFRPENIQNYETDNDDDTFPKDALKYEHRGEVKITGWNKRVLCACEHCGTFRGTLTLHDGDVKEDTYLGQRPLDNPHPFKKAIPHWHYYADQKTMPQLRPPVWEGLRLGQEDSGTPGPISGQTTTTPQAIPPSVAPDPLLYLCLLGSGGGGGGGQAADAAATNPAANNAVYGTGAAAIPSAAPG